MFRALWPGSKPFCQGCGQRRSPPLLRAKDGVLSWRGRAPGIAGGVGRWAKACGHPSSPSGAPGPPPLGWAGGRGGWFTSPGAGPFSFPALKAFHISKGEGGARDGESFEAKDPVCQPCGAGRTFSPPTPLRLSTDTARFFETWKLVLTNGANSKWWVQM